MVKIQTHRGHSLQQGPPDRTMAQKLHLESLPPPQPPAPSPVTPKLKVPCKKLDFCLAPGTHTAQPLLHPSDSQRGLHTHSCGGIQLRSARTHRSWGRGPSTKRSVWPPGVTRPLASPPTAKGAASHSPGSPRMGRRQSFEEGDLPMDRVGAGHTRRHRALAAAPGASASPVHAANTHPSPRSPSHPASVSPPL